MESLRGVGEEIWWVVHSSYHLAFSLNSRYPGDVFYLDIPTQPVLVLNSAQAVFDLLEKRSEIYSDRPLIVMDEL